MAKKKEAVKEIPTDIGSLTDIINRKYGSGAIMLGRKNIVDVDIIPTNIPSLDIAFGVGGIPRGRIIELYGTESSGKTTTCLNIIAACQQHFIQNKDRLGRAAFIDAEHAIDPVWAENIGVNFSELLFSQPNSGEEALNIAGDLAHSGLVDFIVIDSVAALIPKKVLDGELEESDIGAQARLMSKAMKKLCGICARSQSSIIFINQIREKIGVMFGNPETTPGGRALRFYTTMRIEIRKGEAIKEGDTVVGFVTRVKLVKNKTAAPFAAAEYDICFGLPARPKYGVDFNASILDTGIEHKVLAQKGTMFKYGNTILGNGRNKAIQYLANNHDIAKEIKDKIYDVALGHLVKSPHMSDDLSIEPEDMEIVDEDDDEQSSL